MGATSTSKGVPLVRIADSAPRSQAQSRMGTRASVLSCHSSPTTSQRFQAVDHLRCSCRWETVFRLAFSCSRRTRLRLQAADGLTCFSDQQDSHAEHEILIFLYFKVRLFCPQPCRSRPPFAGPRGSP